MPALEEFLTDFSFELIHTPRNLDPKKYPDIRDPDDLPIVASAILGDCDYLITGDKDVLAVKIERPQVLTPADFLETEGEDELE